MPDHSLKQFLQWNRFDPKGGVRHLLPSTLGGNIRRLIAMNFRCLDSLQSNQQLNINDQLVSNNRRVNLSMQGNGNLVLYRTHFGQALWASDTSLPVDHIIMKGDGVLAACSPESISYWDTGTSGHPGAKLLLQDDGNLIIYDTAGKLLWASNTVQDFISPTFKYTDSNGYEYVETSEHWKDKCFTLPCFEAMYWPGYDTKVFKETINGQEVIVQLWKGRCQQIIKDFPGGVGAEVGIYRKIPLKALNIRSYLESSVKNWVNTDWLHYLFGRDISLTEYAKNIFSIDIKDLITTNPSNYVEIFRDLILDFSTYDIWWPVDPAELNLKIEFNMINPITNNTFFSAGPEKSYWLAKWMIEDSYKEYQRAQGEERTPSSVVDYILEFKINGNIYRW
jgi:hypothetical protein